jgi:hypothetical protein
VTLLFLYKVTTTASSLAVLSEINDCGAALHGDGDTSKPLVREFCFVAEIASRVFGRGYLSKLIFSAVKPRKPAFSRHSNV